MLNRDLIRRNDRLLSGGRLAVLVLSSMQLLETVVYGRKNVSASPMPAFGEAVDVTEKIDDIYSGRKARAEGVVGRVRPELPQ